MRAMLSSFFIDYIDTLQDNLFKNENDLPKLTDTLPYFLTKNRINLNTA